MNLAPVSTFRLLIKFENFQEVLGGEMVSAKQRGSVPITLMASMSASIWILEGLEGRSEIEGWKGLYPSES